MGAGRPKTRGDLSEQAIEDELIDRITGGEGITEICNDQHMPHNCEVYRRMARDAEFAERIARARVAQQERQVDLCVDMADAATEGDWQAVKLRIWARQWRAAKLSSKYGDKVANANVNVAFTINAAPVSRIATDVGRVADSGAVIDLQNNGLDGFVLSAPLPSETGGSGK